MSEPSASTSKAHLGDPGGEAQRDVLARLLDTPIPLTAQAKEVVVLEQHLGSGREKFNASVGMFPPR